jgi:hypothetical protein
MSADAHKTPSAATPTGAPTPEHGTSSTGGLLPNVSSTTLLLAVVVAAIIIALIVLRRRGGDSGGNRHNGGDGDDGGAGDVDLSHLDEPEAEEIPIDHTSGDPLENDERILDAMQVAS